MERKTGNCKLCDKPILPQYAWCYGCMIKTGSFALDGRQAQSLTDQRDNRLKLRDQITDNWLAKHDKH